MWIFSFLMVFRFLISVFCVWVVLWVWLLKFWFGFLLMMMVVIEVSGLCFLWVKEGLVSVSRKSMSVVMWMVVLCVCVISSMSVMMMIVVSVS